MATLTAEQIAQKKQQLKQLAEEVKQLKDELVEAGAWPLNENELDLATGGTPYWGYVDPFKTVTPNSTNSGGRTDSESSTPQFKQPCL